MDTRRLYRAGDLVSRVPPWQSFVGEVLYGQIDSFGVIDHPEGDCLWVRWSDGSSCVRAKDIVLVRSIEQRRADNL